MLSHWVYKQIGRAQEKNKIVSKGVLFLDNREWKIAWDSKQNEKRYTGMSLSRFEQKLIHCKSQDT